MTQELHYTSLPRGLKPGSRGFCTVASTPRMTGPLAERLESLSGYVPVYPVHDAAASRNPINFMHLKLAIGGKSVSVLSRVGPANLDYSGRTNNYAHHVVVEANERAAGGPAWALSQPGFLKKAWEGEPRELPEGSPAPQGDRPAGVARDWQTHTGDAGWAGVLAVSFLADPKRPAVLVFRPGMELLPLFVEAIALLPPARRWDVEFSTYFTTLPQGVNCPWRGVLEGSAEAEGLLRLPNALVINLCRPSGRAEGRALVEQARTGVSPEPPRVEVGASNAGQPGKGKSSPPGRRVPGAAEAPIRGAAAGNEPFVAPGAPRPPSRPPASGRRPAARRNTGRNWSIAAGIVTLCVAGLATTAYFLFPWTGADSTAEIKPDPQVAKSGPTPAKDPIPTELNGTKVAQAGPNAEAPKPTPKATDPTNGIDPTNESRGQKAAVAPPQAKKEGEGTNVQDKSEPKVVAAMPPKSKNPDEGDPADPKPGTKTVATEPEPSVNRNMVLAFDLKDPKDASGPQKFELTPNTSRGTVITSLALRDLNPKPAKTSPATDATSEPKPTLESGLRGNGTLDVRVKASKGGLPADDQLVAHFGIEDGRITFDWDKFGLENGEPRNLLRNCLLEITAKDEKTRYALLRKLPTPTLVPFRLRDREKSASNIKGNPYYPLRLQGTFSKSVILSKSVTWYETENKDYKYLSKNLIILEITAPLVKSRKELKFVEDNEKWHLPSVDNAIMTVGIEKGSNDIKFKFSQNGDGQFDRDATLKLIEELLDTGFSMILGLKMDKAVVELVRIGSYEKAKNP